MKIIDIIATKLKLELIKPIVVAIGSVTQGETVIVKIITDEGICGYGEGAGVTFVTGETNNTVIEAIEIIKSNLIGLDPLSIDHIHRVMDNTIVRNASAKAAIDIALYDIIGKIMKAPLYKVLGGIRNKIETDMTISIDKPEIMAKEAKEIVNKGFNYIKVKAGLNPDEDIKAIGLIREAVGENVHIKVDANQGWSTGDAIQIMNKIHKYKVDAVEQPVASWDIEGLSYIRSKTNIKVMADESCFTPYDAISLIRKNAVDMINIKLMKCGGLYRAIQINSIAEASGVRCMVGCMMESKLSIAAGAALVASRQNFLYGDLDSFLYFKDNERIKGGFSVNASEIKFDESYGHGIEVDM